MTVQLKSFNTFGVKASCREKLDFARAEDISHWVKTAGIAPEEILVVGGGSNLLFVNHTDLTLLSPCLTGRQYHDEKYNTIKVTVGAGENWHQLVKDTLAKNYTGLENLSLIPGNVGAAPIQNIGAYGVELADRFDSLEAVDLVSGEVRHFSRAECQFGYRDSIFKGKYRNRFVITRVTLHLDRQPHFVLDYGNLRARLAEVPADELTGLQVSEAVCEERRSKLPDPARLGNAGSFFKNPVVSAGIHTDLRQRFPDLVAFPLESGDFKLAAGWLIEKAGLKGFRQGDAGVHEKQALVLVNYGDASGKDILALARRVQESVNGKFGVLLEPEVRIIGDQHALAN